MQENGSLTDLQCLRPEHPAVLDLLVAHVQPPLGQVNVHVDHRLRTIAARGDPLRKRSPIHDNAAEQEKYWINDVETTDSCALGV